MWEFFNVCFNDGIVFVFLVSYYQLFKGFFKEFIFISVQGYFVEEGSVSYGDFRCVEFNKLGVFEIVLLFFGMQIFFFFKRVFFYGFVDSQFDYFFIWFQSFNQV